MNQQTIRHIRRQRDRGVKLKVLCETYGIGMVELREILEMPKIVKAKRVSEWDAAIQQLRGEGFTDEAIRAVFGQ